MNPLKRAAIARAHIDIIRLLTAILFAVSAEAQTITTRSLDFGSVSHGNSGQFTSLAVINGNPAICCFGGTTARNPARKPQEQNLYPSAHSSATP